MGGAKVHLHALGFGPWLVAELDQGHQHGQAQAAHKDVEDPSHIGQAQSLRRLVLQRGSQSGGGGEGGVGRVKGQLLRGGEVRWLVSLGGCMEKKITEGGEVELKFETEKNNNRERNEGGGSER